MEDKPIPELEERETQPAKPNNAVFVDYIFKPGLIGSIVSIILWVTGASFASAFNGGAGSKEWVQVVHNVAQTIGSISAALFWSLFLPGLIVGIIFTCIRRK